MKTMHSSSRHCCCCVVSVFSALVGVIMLAIGVCLILNYGIFNVKMLPPDWQNDDGKKIVGIILTCCGLGGLILSFVVGALFFTICNKTGKATTNRAAPSLIVTTPQLRGNKDDTEISSTVGSSEKLIMPAHTRSPASCSQQKKFPRQSKVDNMKKKTTHSHLAILHEDETPDITYNLQSICTNIVCDTHADVSNHPLPSQQPHKDSSDIIKEPVRLSSLNSAARCFNVKPSTEQTSEDVKR